MTSVDVTVIEYPVTVSADWGTRTITVDVTRGVPETRNINTTSPLVGGGALSSDLTLSIDQAIPAVTRSAGNYELSSTDAYTSQIVTAAAQITVPPNIFAVGTIINVFCQTSGTVTLVAGSGVTIKSKDGLTLNGENSAAGIYQYGTNLWQAVGALKT